MSDLDGHMGCTADHQAMPNPVYAEHLRAAHDKCGVESDFLGRDIYCSEQPGHEGEHVSTRSGLTLDESSTYAYATKTGIFANRDADDVLA